MHHAQPRSRTRNPWLAAAAGLALATGALLGHAHAARAADPGELGRGARLDRSAFGVSGRLRTVFAEPQQPLSLPLVWAEGGKPLGLRYDWAPTFGTVRHAGGLLGAEPMQGLEAGLRTPASPGMWRLRLRGDSAAEELSDLTVVTRVPFSAKRDGYVNGYFMGRWATEGDARLDRYAAPTGFVEVTPENQDLQLSEHFRLRQFLTKDQFRVWPKYVALDLRLIDKLELVMQELEAIGVPARRMHVMSGFRTPQYNEPGVGAGGRAKLSRHTYGDAADVWVDNDADGYIDDLNGDGRRDPQDARVMAYAADRVETKYPELAGGIGVYRDNGAHGPFIHIDVRGSKARW